MINDLYNNIVIIGGNAAGLAAANQVKRVNPEINVTVLESGKYISYGSCGLPYYIAGVTKNFEDLFAYPASYFEEKKKIKILTDTRVTSVDPFKKEIIVDNNGNIIEFKYDRLIICSGASPYSFDIPGKDADNIFYFHNVDDAVRLKKFIDSSSPGQAAVVGGGYIGLLIADALAQNGIKVSVIELKKKIYSEYEDDITDILNERIRESGVRVLANTGFDSVSTDISGQNAYSISVNAGVENSTEKTEIDTDLILFTAGIHPNTSFLSGSAIDLSANRAIKVTSRQKTSQPNIYAAGDCCTVTNIVTGSAEYIPTAANAIKTGRVAGANAAGENEIFPGSAGTKVDKIFGLEIAKTGISLKEANDFKFNALKITGSYRSHAKAVPDSKPITITLIIDKSLRRILGAQMIGEEGVSKRIDIFAAAISSEMTIDDVYMLDLSYSPALSTVPDPINNICGKAVVTLNKAV